MAEVGARSSALGTAGSDDTTVLAPKFSVSQRLKCGLLVFAIQKFLFAPLHFFERLYDLLTPSTGDRPTVTKAYPSRKSLPVR